MTLSRLTKHLIVAVAVCWAAAPQTYAIADEAEDRCAKAVGIASLSKAATDNCHVEMQSEDLATAAISCSKSLGWNTDHFMGYAGLGEQAWTDSKKKYGKKKACQNVHGVADKTYDLLFGPRSQ